MMKGHKTCVPFLQTFANADIVIPRQASLLKRGSVSSIIYATGNMVSILVLATFLVAQPGRRGADPDPFNHKIRLWCFLKRLIRSETIHVAPDILQM